MVCVTLLQPPQRGFKPILRICTGSVVRHQPCMHGEGWAAEAYLPHEALCITAFTPWLINDGLQVALHPIAQQHLSLLFFDKEFLCHFGLTSASDSRQVKATPLVAHGLLPIWSSDVQT